MAIAWFVHVLLQKWISAKSSAVDQPQQSLISTAHGSTSCPCLLPQNNIIKGRQGIILLLVEAHWMAGVALQWWQLHALAMMSL